MHIAIAGNIGAGKTTLSRLLAAHYGWHMLPEVADANPYLVDFYADMARWAFHVQVHFLNSRFEQVLEMNRLGGSVIQDRTIYEDAYVFARNLRESGWMSQRDYQTYLQLFGSLSRLVRPPDLLVYLEADLPKLTAQIAKRGNGYEKNLDADYLAALQEYYRQWIGSYAESPVIRINATHLDYVANEADFRDITRRIDKMLPPDFRKGS